MKFTHQKVLAITNLPGPDRYSHFVKVAADLRSVWGLYQDGWALMRDSDGNSYFPLWPAEPYAAQCAASEWAGYQPREIDLDDLFDALIPKLLESDTGVAVFPTPGERGVTPAIEMLETDLRAELSRIE